MRTKLLLDLDDVLGKAVHVLAVARPNVSTAYPETPPRGAVMALLVEARGLGTAEASTASVAAALSSGGGRRSCEAETLHVLQAPRGVRHEGVNLAELALDDLRDLLVVRV